MKNERLYGNCKPFCGLLSPFISNILFLFFIVKILNIAYKYIFYGSCLFLFYMFLFFIIFRNDSVKNFIYFDNFEKTKEKKNGIILFLSFFFQLITLYILNYLA
jgi:hypothetical protein